jgi:transposase, IS30 family
MQKKKFVGLQDAERSEISILQTRGCSIREIAKALGRSPNTVSYEIKTNSVNGVYDPLKAKAKSRVARRSRRYQWCKIEREQKLYDYVIAGLLAGWNPDEISGAMKREDQPFYVSAPRIYAWLYSAQGQQYCPYLASRRYRLRKHKAEPRERVSIPEKTGIVQRPLGATNRTRYGHWEGDTIVSGKRTGSKIALAVVIERKTRLVRAKLVPNLGPGAFASATSAMLAKAKVHSLTLDNGIENRHHKTIAKTTGTKVYFCDPYSSWQKGSVEHANKLLRRYLPKGCDLGQFDQSFVDAVVDRLNKKPRKILGYKSALQLAAEKGLLLEKVS